MPTPGVIAGPIKLGRTIVIAGTLTKLDAEAPPVAIPLATLTPVQISQPTTSGLIHARWVLKSTVSTNIKQGGPAGAPAGDYFELIPGVYFFVDVERVAEAYLYVAVAAGGELRMTEVSRIPGS